MKISLADHVKRLGLAAAIAAFAYQPAMQANMQTPVQTVGLPSPTVPMLDITIATGAKDEASKPTYKNQNVTATKQLGQGASFVGVSGHTTTGSAQIVEENGQRYLELDQAFSSESGPDLFVLLHRDAVPTSYSPEQYVNLGRIQSLSGAQRYAIPADVDITQLQSAVIWCQDFDVTFGYATL